MNLPIVLLFIFIFIISVKLISNSLRIGIIIYLVFVGISSVFFNPGQSDSIFTLGGIHIYFMDFCSIIFFTVLFYRIFTGKNKNNIYKPLLIYSIIELAYVFISFLYYGTYSFTASKGGLYFLAPLLYFLTFDFEPIFLKKILKYFYLYVIFLIVIGVFRFAGIIPLPAYYEGLIVQGASGIYQQYRVMNAYQALDLVVFIFTVIYLIQIKEIKLKNNFFILILSFSIILIAQQRTVWLIAGISFLIYFLLNIKNLKILFIGTAAAIILSAFLVFVEKDNFLFNIYAQSFLSVINDPQNSTGALRYYQASYLLGQIINNYSLLYGKLYGSPVTSLVGDQWIDFGIHMYHISKLYYGGLILFIPYVMFQMSMLVISTKIKIFPKFHIILFLIILSNIIFNFTTSPSLIAPLYYFVVIYLYQKKWGYNVIPAHKYKFAFYNK